MIELIGRDRELAELAGLVASARTGMSVVRVVRGEAGMGKTALLDQVSDAAMDMHVVRTAGIEAEIEMGYAALQRLLIPLGADIDVLPEPQRDALDVALGRRDGPPADAFLIGLATLTLLAQAATTKPLLCIVDDAQWIDKNSIDALSFVARRLLADGVVLLFAERDSEERSLSLERLDELVLQGLGHEDALALLEATTEVMIDRSVADYLIDATGGNPLALVELAGTGLSSDQLNGVAALPESLPIGPHLEERFASRARELPEPTQRLLLLAAADPDSDPARLFRAANSLGIPLDSSDPAEDAHLVSMSPTIAFRHPLVRSAVYGGATNVQRRQAHRALADACDRGNDSDQRARHLAAAATGPDEAVAVALEESAERARARGGSSAELACIVRAAELTPDRKRRAGRYLAAVVAGLPAFTPERTQGLLDLARPALEDPFLIAIAQRLQGIVFVMVRPDEAPRALRDAALALAPIDRGIAIDTICEALSAAFMAREYIVGTDSVEIASLALELLGDDDESSLERLVLRSLATLLTTGYEAAMPLLREAARALSAPGGEHELSDAPQWFLLGAYVCEASWDLDAQRAWLERVELAARRRGSLFVLMTNLLTHSIMATRQGRITDAEAYVAEGMELANLVGLSEVRLDGMPGAETLAARGDDEAALRSIERAEAAAETMRGGALLFTAALAHLNLTMGRAQYDEALRIALHLEESHELRCESNALSELIEAAIRCGEREVAAAAFARFELRATASETPLALGLLARLRALMAADERSETFFAEALDHLAGDAFPLELGRTHLAYGEWLRRRNRRTDARVELRAAIVLFEACRTEPYAERARSELRASGEHARKRTPGTDTDLTPQEGQIAKLAALGATNPEIATRLFISPSTVEHHLSKVYLKLQITSRRQLPGVLPADNHT